MDVGCKHGWQMWLVNVVHKTWSTNPVCKHGPQTWSVSGPLCHLVRSLQTERYSAEDTLYQTLTPWWKPYPSTRAYTRAGL